MSWGYAHELFAICLFFYVLLIFIMYDSQNNNTIMMFLNDALDFA